jgi:uncharacterized protein (TIGR02145 family)
MSQWPSIKANRLLAVLFLLTHVAADTHLFSWETAITHGNKTYKTVEIGTQTWMAENLNYEAEGSLCYENKPANCAKYGRLYNWETAMKVCPEGWHLPNNAEWDKLYRFVDGDTNSASPYESPTAGKHLKATRGWNSVKGASGNGTDDYDFSALPGGYRYSDGSFRDVGSVGIWWSASEDEDNKNNAYYRFIYHYDEYAHWRYHYKYFLLSVRCVQD